MHFGETTSVETQRCPNLRKVCKDGTGDHSKEQGTMWLSLVGTAWPQTELILAASTDVPSEEPRGTGFHNSSFHGKAV